MVGIALDHLMIINLDRVTKQDIMVLLIIKLIMGDNLVLLKVIMDIIMCL